MNNDLPQDPYSESPVRPVSEPAKPALSGAADPGTSRVHGMILVTVSLVSLVSAIDMSIVNIALPAIVSDMGVSIGLGSLATLSFLLTLTSLTLVMGKLADRFGLWTMFFQGFLVFGLGSVLCGIAPHIVYLIGARVIQAAGIAMLASVGPAIIARHLPASVLGRSLGYLIASAALGYALGPVIGGFIIQFFSWRWIFFVTLPPVTVSLLLGLRYIPRDIPQRPRDPFDTTGTVLSITAIAGILSAFALLQVPGIPDMALVALFAAGIIAGAGFIQRERRNPDPLILTGPAVNQGFSLGIISCFIVTTLFSGATYLLPLYMINSRHLDPSVAGLILMVPALISLVAAPFFGSLSDRFGSPAISAATIGISTLGFFLIFTFNPVTGLILIMAGILVSRVFSAAFFGPNAKQILENCPRESTGTGAGMLMLVRHAGLLFGIALFQNIFALRMYLEGIPRNGTPLVPRLTPALSVQGYQAVYAVAICLCIVVIVLSLFVRETGRRRQCSGAAECDIPPARQHPPVHSPLAACAAPPRPPGSDDWSG